MEHWYRFEEETRTPYWVDECGDVRTLRGVPLQVRVRLTRPRVLRHTPKGVQLIGGRYGSSRPRFVLHASNKKWAHPTIEEALESYVARKNAQARLLRRRADAADLAASLAASGNYETLRWMDE